LSPQWSDFSGRLRPKVFAMTKTLLFSILLGLVGLTLWQSGALARWRLKPATAFLGQSPVAASPDYPSVDSEQVMAEGRVVPYPGSEIVLSSEMAGKIAKVYPNEKTPVRKGDVIAELKSDDIRAVLDEAKAVAEERDAELKFATWEAQRVQSTAGQGTFSELERQRSQRDADAASARRSTAAAAVRKLEASLEKTRIVAPIDGVVTARLVHPGENVENGSRVVTIANLDKVRIEAEVDEYDAGVISMGADVTILVEGYAGRSWKGKVEEIPDTVAIRKLKPEDPRRPTDTRVLLVKIALTEPTPLKLGQRVEVQIQRPDSAKSKTQ
jgi:HlyD family secretion protein